MPISLDGTTKECPDCQRVLPVAAFGRNKRTGDGFACYCRACFKARFRPDYVKRVKRGSARVAERLATGLKTCAMCKERKPFDSFYLARNKPDGHYCYCRPCHQKLVRKGQRAKRDALRAKRQ